MSLMSASLSGKLSHYWDMKTTNGESLGYGNFVLDRIGNANMIQTQMNQVATAGGDSYTPVSGLNGSGLESRDGINIGALVAPMQWYSTVGNTFSSLYWGPGSGSFTLAWWDYQESLADGYGPAITCCYGAQAANEQMLYTDHNANGDVDIYAYYGTGSYMGSITATGINPPLSGWKLWTLVVDKNNSEMTLYCNASGQTVSTNSNIANLHYPGKTNVGTLGVNLNGYQPSTAAASIWDEATNYKMDSFMVFSEALSSSEVSDLYNSGSGVTLGNYTDEVTQDNVYDSLEHYYSFDQSGPIASGGSLSDLKGSADLTLRARTDSVADGSTSFAIDETGVIGGATSGSQDPDWHFVRNVWDGTTQTADSAFNVMGSGQPFSVSYWWKGTISGNGDNDGIIGVTNKDKSVSNNDGHPFTERTQDFGDQLYSSVTRHDGINIKNFQAGGYTQSASTWNHILFSYDPQTATARKIINGVTNYDHANANSYYHEYLAACAFVGMQPDDDYELTLLSINNFITSSTGGIHQNSNNSIDEVAFFSAALDQRHAEVLYNGGSGYQYGVTTVASGSASGSLGSYMESTNVVSGQSSGSLGSYLESEALVSTGSTSGSLGVYLESSSTATGQSSADLGVYLESEALVSTGSTSGSLGVYLESEETQAFSTLMPAALSGKLSHFWDMKTRTGGDFNAWNPITDRISQAKAYQYITDRNLTQVSGLNGSGIQWISNASQSENYLKFIAPLSHVISDTSSPYTKDTNRTGLWGPGSGSFTISWWEYAGMYALSSTYDMAGIGSWDSSNGGADNWLEIETTRLALTSGTYTVRFYEAGSGTTTSHAGTTAGISIPATGWTMYTVSVDKENGDLDFYVNGSGTNLFSGSSGVQNMRFSDSELNSTQRHAFIIGGHHGNQGAFEYNGTSWAGKMAYNNKDYILDSACVFNEALDSSEVSSLYNSGSGRALAEYSETSSSASDLFQNDLVHYYSFDDTGGLAMASGAVLEDQKGSFDLTLRDDLFGTVASGSTFTFDGSSSMRDYSPSADQDDNWAFRGTVKASGQPLNSGWNGPTGPQDSYTINFWVKGYRDSDDFYALGLVNQTQSNTSLDGNPFYARLNGFESYDWTFVNDSQDGSAKTTYGGGISDFDWSMATATYNADANLWRCYRDGSYQDSLSIEPDTKMSFPGDEANDDYEFVIGSMLNAISFGHGVFGSTAFDHQIDEVMIFNRDLNPEEVSNLYNSGSGEFHTNSTVFASGSQSGNLAGYMEADNVARGATSGSLGGIMVGSVAFTPGTLEESLGGYLVAIPQTEASGTITIGRPPVAVHSWDTSKSDPSGYRHIESGPYKPAAKGDLIGGFSKQNGSNTPLTVFSSQDLSLGSTTNGGTKAVNVSLAAPSGAAFSSATAGDIVDGLNIYNVTMWLNDQSGASASGISPSLYYKKSSSWLGNVALTPASGGVSGFPTAQGSGIALGDITTGSNSDQSSTDYVYLFVELPSGSYSPGVVGGTDNDYSIRISYDFGEQDPS